MTKLALLILVLSAAAQVDAQIPTTTTSPAPIRSEVLENDPELRQVVQGINSNLPSLSGIMWSLTHAYESKEEMEKALNFFMEFMQAVQENDKKKIADFGGGRGFKDRFVTFLSSGDEAVKGFAAAILGFVGDVSYAPRLAALINARDPSFTEKYPAKPVFHRGRAAMALGNLGATAYKEDIAKLLKSANDFDRSGAVYALTAMKAVEFTPQIVALLSDPQLRSRDDASPIQFLVESGQAKRFKPLLVQVMLTSIGGERSDAAAYALVAVGAKEHAPSVAKLLKDEFRKRVGVKVLALLGARQYIPHIAALLNDTKSLVRNDATFALGVLNARQYAPRVAKSLDNKSNDGSDIYAAEALLLMGATEHYTKARAVIAFKISERPYPIAGELHPFVASHQEAIRKRLETAIDKSKP